AALLAVAVARRAGEELDAPFARELAEGVEGDRGHAPLVRLVRAVDVEVAQARDLGARRPEHAPDVLVEQELGVAVDVERLLAGALLAELAPAAVDRGRRG